MVFVRTNFSIPKVMAMFSSFHKSFGVLKVAVFEGCCFIIVSVASLKYFVKFSVSVFLCMITFLGLIRLIVGVVFTSAYIAWWSDMPGSTSTLFTRLGVLVSRRSSILFPRVSFSFSCVREKLFTMSRSCVCRLVFEQCCLVVNIFQLMSGKLK